MTAGHDPDSSRDCSLARNRSPILPRFCAAIARTCRSRLASAGLCDLRKPRCVLWDSRAKSGAECAQASQEQRVEFVVGMQHVRDMRRRNGAYFRQVVQSLCVAMGSRARPIRSDRDRRSQCAENLTRRRVVDAQDPRPAFGVRRAIHFLGLLRFPFRNFCTRAPERRPLLPWCRASQVSFPARL